MVVGQLDVYMQKNGVVFPTANHINKITQNGSKYKNSNHKIIGEEYRDFGFGNGFVSDMRM